MCMAQKRARELGLSFGELPIGELNSITDVPGVLVGHTTVIEDHPRVIRSGVTTILPNNGKIWEEHCYAGIHSLNGHGEITGAHWIKEGGLLNSAIGLTGSFNVGLTYSVLQEFCLPGYGLPVVAETSDAFLNGRQRNLISREHILASIKNANSEKVAEGNVGGGTGMICYQFKGGIGSASRKVLIDHQEFVVGVLVQANYGLREHLIINGKPIGKSINSSITPLPTSEDKEKNSVIVIIATNAPLLPYQCNRLAQRSGLGLAKLGCAGHNMSGDLMLAFSTGNTILPNKKILNGIKSINNNEMNILFDAVIDATEESVVNALVAAETMVGFEGRKVFGFPKNYLMCK